MKRRDLERFLLRNGFEQKPGGMTSHRLFIRNGVTIVIPGHGAQDMSKKMSSLITRQLEAAGISREALRKEVPR